MGGLRQNTDDYDYIWQQFLDPDNEAYDIENYNKDDIYNDPNRSFFKNRNYDARQFKLSLGRLVNKLKAHLQEEQRGVPDEDADNTGMADIDGGGDLPAPKSSVKSPPPSAKKMTSPRPTSSKKPAAKTATASFPFEITVNDELELLLPHHMFTWKDNLSNDRVTLMVLLPVGTTKEMLSPRVETGGLEVTMDYIWPPTMLNEMVPMFLGSENQKKFYQRGHIKISHYRDSIKALRCGDQNKRVKSVFRVDMPFRVEEQFAKEEVPRSVSIVKFKVGDAVAKCLFMELMGLRDNYLGAGEIDEFAYDLGNLSLDD